MRGNKRSDFRKRREIHKVLDELSELLKEFKESSQLFCASDGESDLYM